MYLSLSSVWECKHAQCSYMGNGVKLGSHRLTDPQSQLQNCLSYKKTKQISVHGRFQWTGAAVPSPSWLSCRTPRCPIIISPLHGLPRSQALGDLYFLCTFCFLSLQGLPSPAWSSPWQFLDSPFSRNSSSEQPLASRISGCVFIPTSEHLRQSSYVCSHVFSLASPQSAGTILPSSYSP